MLNILQGALGAGTRVKLTGITGDSSEAEFVDAIFPVVTKDQQRYLIRIQGQNIVATKATNTIMSLAVLLKAGYDVKFKVGTKGDAADGGILYTPDGKEIALTFKDNMWRLPMWSKPVRQDDTHAHVNSFSALPCHDIDMSPTSVQEARETAYPGDVVDFVVQHTNADFLTASTTLDAYNGDVVDTIVALKSGPAAAAAPEHVVIQANVSNATRPCDISPLDLSIADQVRLCHDRDGHPSKNKHRQIFKARRGRGFPANFLAHLQHFKCETCAVTAGARAYRQSKRVQEKGYHKKGENAAKSATDRSQVGTDMASCDAACACCATTDGADAHIECFTNAASNAHNQEPAQQPRLVHAPKHRMHIDWANSITLAAARSAII
jgi:NACalpha-BTF3-like transcription factor